MEEVCEGERERETLIKRNLKYRDLFLVHLRENENKQSGGQITTPDLCGTLFCIPFSYLWKPQLKPRSKGLSIFGNVLHYSTAVQTALTLPRFVKEYVISIFFFCLKTCQIFITIHLAFSPMLAPTKGIIWFSCVRDNGLV